MKSSFKNIIVGSAMNGAIAMVAVTGLYVILGLTGFFTFNRTTKNE